MYTKSHNCLTMSIDDDDDDDGCKLDCKYIPVIYNFSILSIPIEIGIIKNGRCNQ